MLLGPKREVIFLPALKPGEAQFYGHEFLPNEATGKRLGLPTKSVPIGRAAWTGPIIEMLPRNTRHGNLRRDSYEAALATFESALHPLETVSN